MSDTTRLGEFKTFLTEHFTTLAVEVFTEVENIVGACFEENKRLRSMLHMVLSPEIKLHKIDVTPYTEPSIREEPAEPNTRSANEISEPMMKRPKEEETEYDIQWGSEKLWPDKMDNSDLLDCVKSEEQEAYQSPVSNSFTVQVVEYNQDSSITVSTHDAGAEQDDSFSVSSDETLSSSSLQTNIDSSSSQKHQTNPETSITSKSKPSQQKTLLHMPRIIIHKSFTICPAEREAFLTRLSDAYKDFPDDQKPLITKLDLKTNVKMVKCAVGEVPEGSPLSYQCPLPSIQDYKPCDNPSPQPPLPSLLHPLQPVSVFPTLSLKEQERLNSMVISWDEARELEVRTRGSKEAAEKSLKMRLVSRFREITKLKVGRSHAEQLLFKIMKGNFVSKTLDCQAINEETKPEAIREYCRNLYINWSPCGLVVHPNAPWLGAIPDGVVYDPKEISKYGLIYTKHSDNQSIIESSFLLCRNGTIQLKREHQYFWQIQGQLMVTGLSWCDLLVYAKQDMLVQRIYRDNSLIKNMQRKLKDFFFYFYLPNLG
ncbi:uncharacterized protein LOC106518354 isoform X2 [Austrofundulus limnaeus]|uniref:Uncharacterized protein LOC106518354 isoform X2 n=1 Tax=Austrofundulus limnaeus TaxID=52670 RepID=A0A2I4BBG4_AUSLI|nr:PREDICTED: uncharacterized protein LOC106518354 isoform X2 [Austrofundulus limnaeus]